ncbi:MAG: DUF3473 domain-containing protein [Desulfamplus sp.]|nr:DUF3473 domain-containing protein [Desulfamplus sp.]
MESILNSCDTKKHILLTFDVEDWFQVENFKGYIPFSSWDSYELRVEKNTHEILDLLDSFSFSVKATFFVMGWIAQKLPQLVREIQSRGHEVASHGLNHHLCAELSPGALAADLEQSKKLLEDITGIPIAGYRAPSFAINNDILKLIKDAGYMYDSSYNSFGMHGRYGKIDLPERLRQSQVYRMFHDTLDSHDSDNHGSCYFHEIPISNLSVGSKVFPLGGGGYFRLIPFPLFRMGIKKILTKQDAFVFYSHPWEFDPLQPRVRQASVGFRFRHYTNLHRTRKKLITFIESFSAIRFSRCSDYVTSTLAIQEIA